MTKYADEMSLEEQIEMINNGQLPPLRPFDYGSEAVVENGVITYFEPPFAKYRAKKYRREHGLPLYQRHPDARN